MNIQDIIGETTICIMGQKGSGKTYAMMLLANMVKDKPVFFFDTLGVASQSRLMNIRNIYKAEPSHLNADEQTFNKIFAKMKKEGGGIFNLSALIPAELAEFADIFARWAMRNRDFALFVDELADYCPQDSRYYSAGLERIWRDGRNYGIRPVCLSTQRPQAAAKNLLALSDIYIIFRMFHNLDRSKVRDLIGFKKEEWEEFEKRLMSLDTRECYVFTKKLELTPMRMPELRRR